MKNKQNTRRGFTLIELLVVVLIIGILAAVAVPQYRTVVARGKLTTLKHLVEAIAQAEEIYYIANGKYTPDISSLDVAFPTPSINDIGTNHATYTYPWGKCTIHGGPNQTTSQFVNCKATLSEDLALGYEKKFVHSEIMAKSRICLVFGTNSEEKTTTYAHHACQKDTKATRSTNKWYCGGEDNITGYCFRYY